MYDATKKKCNAMHDATTKNKQATGKTNRENAGGLQPTPLTRDRALAVQPKQGEREKSHYGLLDRKSVV